MSLSTPKLLRLLSAAVVVVMLTVTAMNAQDDEGGKREYENDAGDYHYFEIPEKYDIRVSPRIRELNARYKKNYKLLSKEEAEERRAANKKSGEAKKQRRDAFNTVKDVLEGQRPLAQNTRLLDYWFERIVFAEMTQPDTDSLQSLPELRSDFFRAYTQRPRMSKAAHDYVVAKTLKDMKYIAENDFHPAVRYHAMLMIGQLNGEEALPVFSPKAPPVPYQPALPVLINSFTDEEQLEAVRVAALLGIHRHAKLAGSSMADKDRDQIIDVMLATLDAPPGNRTASGHAWIQRRAIEVLGEIGHVGAGGKVAKRLMTILTDEKSSLAMRCSAALAYGKLDFNASVDPQVTKFAYLIGDMVAAECSNRLDWLTKEQELRKSRLVSEQTYESAGGADAEDGGVITTTTEEGSSGAGGYGPGDGAPSAIPSVPGVYGSGGAGGYGDEVDPERAATELERHRLNALRRRIKYPVFCAQRALGGELQRDGDVERQQDWKLDSFLKDEEDRKFVSELAEKLNALQVAADAGREKEDDDKDRRDLGPPEGDDEEVKLPTEAFKEELADALREVKRTLNNVPASARPAAPADESIDAPAGPAGPVGPVPATPEDTTASGPPAGPVGPPAGP